MFNKWKGEVKDEEDGEARNVGKVGLVPSALGHLGSAQQGWAVFRNGHKVAPQSQLLRSQRFLAVETSAARKAVGLL